MAWIAKRNDNVKLLALINFVGLVLKIKIDLG